MKTVIYFIVFLTLSFGVLLLCAWKIGLWFKKENVRQKWQAIRDGHELYPLRGRIERLRVVNLVVFFVLLCVLFPLAKTMLDSSWQVAVPIIVIGVAFWSNNRIVTSLWRCPVCQQELPRILGRSSLRPKMVDNCPYCGHCYIVGKKPDKLFL